MATKFKITGLDELVKDLKEAGKPVNAGDTKRLGKRVISEMKKFISKGISTVRGGGFSGRMPRYKNPAKYPGKRKPKRPVNLKLKGDFQKALISKHSKNVIEIGYFDPAEAIKEKGHREGANKQKKRPTIPEPGKGEQFAASIERTIVKLFEDILKKKTNKF